MDFTTIGLVIGAMVLGLVYMQRRRARLSRDEGNLRKSCRCSGRAEDVHAVMLHFLALAGRDLTFSDESRRGLVKYRWRVARKECLRKTLRGNEPAVGAGAELDRVHLE